MRELDHGKYVAKLAAQLSRPLASSQVTGSGGIKLLTGLIIRRSWVRSPPAPPAPLAQRHSLSVSLG